jgi:hypothetical protein
MIFLKKNFFYENIFEYIYVNYFFNNNWVYLELVYN